MSELIEPFTLSVPEEQLTDLRERLSRTRWPDPETVLDTSQGPQLAKLRALHDYWLNTYDWRRCEKTLNCFGQSRTIIDGLGIHFLHVRSPEPDALPLVMTHGWPSSVLDFHKVIGPVTRGTPSISWCRRCRDSGSPTGLRNPAGDSPGSPMPGSR